MGVRDMDPTVERAVAAFNDHDLDALMNEYAEDGTFNDPLVEEAVSGAELREYTADVFEAFPDVRLEVDRVIAPESGPTAIEGSYVGTHQGPIEGIPATGHSAAVPTMTVIDVSEAGITSWRDYWDQRAFSEQLGLTFPEIIPLIPKLAVAKGKEFV